MSGLLITSLDVSQLGLTRRVAGQAASFKMPAYIVGGPVRDLFLQRPVNDFDVVVEGDAIKLARMLAKAEGGKVTAHVKFGTATWTLDGSALDLSTARSEVYEQPGALPVVKFSTMQDDLRRRDFTINAMAVRLDGDHFGQLLDPLNGQDDLAHKLIRALHPRSFLDDPTRMLRAVRYAERYDFAIVPETLQLINADSRLVLSGLSGERLRHEFDLIFEEEKPSQILARLAEMDLLSPVHPSLTAISHLLPSLKEPPAEWGEFKSAGILSVRQTLGWLCWLMNLSTNEVDTVAGRLAFPAALTKAARAAVSLLADLPSLMGAKSAGLGPSDPAGMSLSKPAGLSLSKPSRWTFYLDDLPTLAVYAVYLREQTPALKEYLTAWRHIQPHTNGDDLKRRGLPPGPEYQKILSRLRAAWLDGEINTREQEFMLVEKMVQAQ